jgi:hypothetical protein
MKRHDMTWFGILLTALVCGSSSLLTGCLAETADVGDDAEPALEQDVEQVGAALTEEPAAAPHPRPAQVAGAPVGRPGAERTTDPQPDPWTGGYTDSSRDPQPDPWQPKTATSK